MKTASSMSWVTNSTVLRSAPRCPAAAPASARGSGGRARRRARPSAASAGRWRARARSRCAAACRPTAASGSGARSPPGRPCAMKACGDSICCGARHAAFAQAEADVVAHREPGEQRVALEHHAAVGARAVDARGRRAAPRPTVWRSSPATMRSSVLLPQPEGPRMVTKSFSARRGRSPAGPPWRAAAWRRSCATRRGLSSVLVGATVAGCSVGKSRTRRRVAIRGQRRGRLRLVTVPAAPRGTGAG